MKLQTILVPLDGSTLAETALADAVDLAEASGARLHLLRAAQARTLPGFDPTVPEIKAVEEAEAYLAGIAERLHARGLALQPCVWYGPPAEAILEAAGLYGVDLIVMTTHGRSGLSRLLLGSVAESVLRGTSTRILLVHGAKARLESALAAS